MKRFLGTGLIWFIFVVPALGTAGWILWREATEPKTVSGPGLIQTDAAIGGPITLVGADGQEVTEQDFAGGPAVIYFGYTFCPDVCPTSLQVVAEALDLLEGDGQAVTPIFITVDPKRDGIEVVGDYAAAFHAQMVGLTGSAEQIAAATKAFRVVYLARDKGRGDEDYLVDHSSYYYLMDAEWKLAAVMAHEITPAQMAAAIRQLL
ncbi:SCO family protein [Hwanghaeella sp.]|uniref:SCO family protein n=1 Tax=Hwanghaeella sp. TaxID=2605943 RepID=UPI003CCC0188